MTNINKLTDNLTHQQLYDLKKGIADKPDQKPVVDKLPPETFELKKGDVFFVQDCKGTTLSHGVINLGQWATFEKHPSIVHAGIALDATRTVEMSGSGIGIFGPNDMHGQAVKVFRFADEAVSSLAADLAENMELTAVKQTLEYMKLDAKHPSDNKSSVQSGLTKPEYSFKKAILSVFSTNHAMSAQQVAELEKLIKNFDFARAKNIKNNLFCSEFVILIFNMSHLILAGGDYKLLKPIERNLYYTNPSQLYAYLSVQPHWREIDVQVVRANNQVSLVQAVPDYIEEEIRQLVSHYGDHEDAARLMELGFFKIDVKTEDAPKPHSLLIKPTVG